MTIILLPLSFTVPAIDSCDYDYGECDPCVPQSS